MNGDEIQYALDRRNQVTLPYDSDNVITKPIQLGHLTGDVFIESEGFSVIGYLGPPGRHVFEYNYSGVHDPPRLFFRGFYCQNTGGGTYGVTEVGFLKVVQPNTSPKAIFIEHCNLGNNRSFLIDGPDVSGCDGIQIKNSEGGGSCFLRWKLRDDAKMGFLDIVNFRYQTNGRVGASTDLKNTRGISWLVYTDEQDTDLIEELRGEYVGPVTHRFVNPRGFNIFMHNWNEYSSNWDVEAPNCWATSIRVDDTSGGYGMHYLRRLMSPFRAGTSTGTKGIQIMGGGSSANAGSLFNEELDDFYTGSFDFSEGTLIGGKAYPKIVDSWDMPDSVNTQYTDLNTNGIEGRYEVYDSDAQPILKGNPRTAYYNTEWRLNRTPKWGQLYYEDTLLALQQKAYGDVNAVTTYDGNDVVVTFTSSGTLTVTEEIQVEYLIAGGGGSGGASPYSVSNRVGGGGGAGGFASNFGGTPVTLTAGSYPVVVGAGGQIEFGTYGQGVDGGSSSFNGITVPGGGGGGGSTDGISFLPGRNGGCGGGAPAAAPISGGSGSAYGFAGGSTTTLTTSPGSSGASGGGGAGGAGGDGIVQNTDGNGGVGVQSSITGTSMWYCEGGGGGPQGDGGIEGGGHCRTTDENNNERDGKPNLGGGGAGGATNSTAGGLTTIQYPGNGSAGVVIIRFSSL